MKTFIRNSDHDIKSVDIFFTFLAGMNVMGIVSLTVMFNAINQYLLLCLIGGILLCIISLRKKIFYLKEITIENCNLVFKTNFLFLSHKYICKVEHIQATRTYYSLIVRCYKPGVGYKTRKFKLSSSKWKNLDKLEKLIISSN